MFNKLKSLMKWILLSMIALGLGAEAFTQSLDQVMKERNLSQQDLLAAAKTYTPSGKKDEYIVII